MRSDHPIEISALAGMLLAGGLLFVWAVMAADAVPAGYRSASPGFGWSWDFDYDAAVRDAGRPGAEPWPWPARETGDRLVLPMDQPLLSRGLKITYRGMAASGRFRLDAVIEGLDPDFTYRLDFDVPQAGRSFTIGERRFRLEKITPRYLRLRSVDRDTGAGGD